MDFRGFNFQSLIAAYLTTKMGPADLLKKKKAARDITVLFQILYSTNNFPCQHLARKNRSLLFLLTWVSP